MGYNKLPVGKNPPHSISVMIEISGNSGPVKYEYDKDTEVMVVDRILKTPMHYPCHYGFVPHTLCDDGDPLDVLVLAPYTLLAGSLIECRPVGVMGMEDESGLDAKVIAVPVSKVCSDYDHVEDIQDIPESTLEKIHHFFEHYKDLDQGKWVKIGQLKGKEAALKEIEEAISMANTN
ncbi:MAG TPA: inorganic diphosphatase [Gammaproteobacteria bacterium]|nr:inorganic diphosphatase [Gammaproteobacteria bacterium]